MVVESLTPTVNSDDLCCKERIIILRLLLHYTSFINCLFEDAPRYLQITPRQSSYQPGDRIQCSAEGNPEPSYQWTDLVSGTVMQGAVLKVTETMLNNSYSFQCNASNQYSSNVDTLNFAVRGITVFITFRRIISFLLL